MMLSSPQIVQRPERHYAAIRTSVARNDIPAVVPPLLPRVFAWLERHRLLPDGPPFFRYCSCTGGQMVVEAGVPLSAPPPGDEEVCAGSLPAGRYVTVLHTGHYSGLQAAHMALESWGENKGLSWQQDIQDDITTLGCRTEFYLTDPDAEPDPARWQTEIAFLISECEETEREWVKAGENKR